MGVKTVIGAESRQAIDYSVAEDSTPLSPADSSGSVGTISMTLPRVEDPHLLVDERIELIDTDRGTTSGFVDSGVRSDANDTVSVDGLGRLGLLNIYNVRAQPFSGTLEEAFRYYLGLASVSTDISVDPSIASRPVVIPGWFGELWFYLKQLASAQECEIALVSNVIHLRPVRTREAIRDRAITRDAQMGAGNKALAVEVIRYETTPITLQPVYPPFGVTNETEVITVGAGEEIEYVLQLSASVSHIEQPQFRSYVGPNDQSASMYSVRDEEGNQITEDRWTRGGGRLSVEINPDTTSLTVRVYAPEGLKGPDRKPISTFSIGQGTLQNENRYSTLRIRGTGVAYTRHSELIRTGLTPLDTSTDVGVTIDNPFITTVDAMYSAGTRAARQYKGDSWSLSGSATAVNKRGVTGDLSYTDYGEVQAAYAGMTYAQVRTFESGVEPTNLIPDPYFEQGTSRYLGGNNQMSVMSNLSLESHLGRTMIKASGGIDTNGVPRNYIMSGDEWIPVPEAVIRGGTIRFQGLIYGGPDYSGDEARVFLTVKQTGQETPFHGTHGITVIDGITPDELREGKWVDVSPGTINLGDMYEPYINLMVYNRSGFSSEQLFASDLRLSSPVVDERIEAPTYGQVQAKWYAMTKDLFENQVFGNVGGARVWDERSRRWYRVRSATISRGDISFDASGDNTLADVQSIYSGQTYGDVTSLFSGKTYKQADRMGLYTGG